MKSSKEPILTASPATSLRHGLMSGAALCLATTVVYLPALRGGFVWEDNRYVTQNVFVQEPEGLWYVWFRPGATDQYYPLVYTSYWLEHRLWGTAPAGYHAVNVGLHAFNALLLWRLLRRLELRTAWWIALIFALHPVNVESVAWVTERKNTLSLLFYLLAATAYVRFEGLPAVEEKRRYRHWPIAFVCFALALLSKTVTVTFPVVMALVIWWKRGRLGGRSLAWLAPMAALAIGAGAVTVWVERHHVGTATSTTGLSTPDRLYVAGRAVLFYLGKLLWPTDLSFIYPRWSTDLGMWRWMYPLSAAGLLLSAWRLRGLIGRGPTTAILYWFVSLAPMLGFVDLFLMRYSFVADHFQYLPCLGLIALFVEGLSRAELSPLPGRVVGALVCCMLGVQTFRQSRVYANEELLWRDVISKHDGVSLAHHNLGLILERRGETDAAIGAYDAALRGHPVLFESLYNRANLLSRAKRYAEAEANYRAALRMRPDMIPAHFNLGLVMLMQGRHPEAERQFEEVLRHDPKDAGAHFRLGMTRMATAQYKSALEHLREAVRLKPEYLPARLGMADCLERMNELPQAIAQYEYILRVEPDNRTALARLAAIRGVPLTRPPDG